MMREIYYGEFRLVLIQHIREVDAGESGLSIDGMVFVALSATGCEGYRTTRFQQQGGKQYPRIGTVLCGYDR